MRLILCARLDSTYWLASSCTHHKFHNVREARGETHSRDCRRASAAQQAHSDMRWRAGVECVGAPAHARQRGRRVQLAQRRRPRYIKGRGALGSNSSTAVLGHGAQTRSSSSKPGTMYSSEKIAFIFALSRLGLGLGLDLGLRHSAKVRVRVRVSYRARGSSSSPAAGLPGSRSPPA
eukprot:scaffold90685_cov69-Phaeocystis_antarctica.AAC.8